MLFPKLHRLTLIITLRLNLWYTCYIYLQYWSCFQSKNIYCSEYGEVEWPTFIPILFSVQHDIRTSYQNFISSRECLKPNVSKFVITPYTYLNDTCFSTKYRWWHGKFAHDVNKMGSFCTRPNFVSTSIYTGQKLAVHKPTSFGAIVSTKLFPKIAHLPTHHGPQDLQVHK